MERVELIPGITRNEAAALAYFAMGVSSEGGYGGRNVAYQLSFAGSTRGNILRPVAGSRFSIGTLQVDLGQHPDVAGELMAAYRAWSAAQAVPQPISAGDVAGWTELERMLSRDGSTIRAEGGRNLSVPIRQGLDSFLESPQGVDFVHDRDLRQIDHLLRADSTLNRSALHAIAGTRLYQDADADGRVRLAAIMLKLENQSGRAIYPRLVRRIERGELEGVDAVERAIHARGDYVSTGVHHTLEGTRTYLALRDATMENPLRHAANEVLADPTIRPTTLTASGNGPSPSLAEYHAVKTMFLQPATATRFLHALDRGDSFAHGKIADRQPGFFASGDRFAYWDGSGRGHTGSDHWREVRRDDIQRINHHDGVVELRERTADGEQTLLRIDRRAPPLRPSSAASLDREVHEQVAQALRPSMSANAVERVTASVMQATTSAGLRQVRQVAASGDRFIAWDGKPGDPASRWCLVSIEQASRTPVEASLAAIRCPSSTEPHHGLHVPTPPVPHTAAMQPAHGSHPTI